MELRRRVNFGKIYFALYFVALSIYFLVGLKPAEAANIESRILIPSIGLVSDVERLELENSELSTPDEIVGSFSRNKNKTLLIGHSSTVFADLKDVKIGDEIIYRDLAYRVSGIVLTLVLVIVLTILRIVLASVLVVILHFVLVLVHIIVIFRHVKYLLSCSQQIAASLTTTLVWFQTQKLFTKFIF